MQRAALLIGFDLAVVVAPLSVASSLMQMFWHHDYPGGQRGFGLAEPVLIACAVLALVLSLIGFKLDRPRAVLAAILALVAMLFLFATPVYG